MNQTATDLLNKSQNWLRQDVFPLWIKNGIDKSNGGFIEALTYEAQPLDVPRRALVQSRQIYSFVTGAKMNSCDPQVGHQIVNNAMKFFSSSYLQKDGSCLHAVTPQGLPHNKDLDLYSQAFAMFALANGYEVSKDQKLKTEALNLLKYLKSDRRAVGGGYTEIKAGKVMFQSNPHMHLFEAALAWMMVDSSPEWKELATELFDLCKTKFVDKTTGALCEHFKEGWIPETTDGKFVFEPGHHYEWSWLMACYQELTGVDCKALRHSLYAVADKHGINQAKHLAIDEVWSDFTAKKKSSRFWPQTERIKAAVKLGLDMPAEQQASFAKSADEAMQALFGFLEMPIQGLWQDTLLENGEFTKQDPKASSLYHIINAMYEYSKIRPKLKA
jgi:mannose-6-phosphate isomerase